VKSDKMAEKKKWPPPHRVKEALCRGGSRHRTGNVTGNSEKGKRTTNSKSNGTSVERIVSQDFLPQVFSSVYPIFS
jgi:hypothetical protein